MSWTTSSKEKLWCPVCKEDEFIVRTFWDGSCRVTCESCGLALSFDKPVTRVKKKDEEE